MEEKIKGENYERDPVTYILTKGFIDLRKIYSEIDIIDILILSKVYFYTTGSKTKKCTLGNEVFGDELGLSERSVTRRIKMLMDLDLLGRRISYGRSYGAISKCRELFLTEKTLSALRHLWQVREDKMCSNVTTNGVETCSHQRPMSNIYSSKEEYKSNRVSNIDADASSSVGANAPQSTSSLSDLEKVSSILDHYGFREISNNTLLNIKKWCKESCNKTNCESNSFNPVVLSDAIEHRSEDLRKVCSKDDSYKFGVLKNIILENYSQSMSKMISRQHEYEEQTHELQESKRTIQYRYDYIPNLDTSDPIVSMEDIIDDIGCY